MNRKYFGFFKITEYLRLVYPLYDLETEIDNTELNSNQFILYLTNYS